MTQRSLPSPALGPVFWAAALLSLVAATAPLEAQGPPFGLPPGPPNFHDRAVFPPGPPFIPPGRPFQGGGPPGLQGGGPPGLRGGGPPGLRAALTNGNADVQDQAETLTLLLAALLETPDALHATVVAYNDFVHASSDSFLRNPPAEFQALHGALTPLSTGVLDGSAFAYAEFVEAGWDAFAPQVPMEILALRELLAWEEPVASAGLE